MGICGTGMGALAGMLQASGYRVTGSDRNVYPPMSDFLASRKIPVAIGYGPGNLAPRPDLVIVGNVITRDNPEVQALAESAIPYLSFPQALAEFFITGKTSLVVAGTHGKTTTSSILASLLYAAGMDPSFMIGGLVQAFGSNFRVAGGRYFVSEGDEYDTAFFDKGPKFLHYRPNIAIITSIEFDHADIYADLAAVKKSFARLVAIMPADGKIVAHLDDPVVREVVAAAPCRVVGYGCGRDCEWRLDEYSVGAEGTSFVVRKNGEMFGSFFSRMPGRHNALNALAVLAVLAGLGVGGEAMRKGLAAFEGVRRRQEVRGVARGVTVIDDFAHHPTAVRETVSALRQSYPGRRLIVVFEPRTNSSRRRVFQDAYVEVFDGADAVLVREPVPLDKVPPEERFSSVRLADDLVKRGCAAQCFANTDMILAHLLATVEAGDVVAILSNGGFDNIHLRLLEGLLAG